MTTVWLGLLWIAGLAIALYAAEKLVHYLSIVADDLHLSPGLLGLLVAAGADAPELTSAVVALARGSSDVGLGVLLGSNIFNLAGLLGLSAIVARRITTNPLRLILDSGTNSILTVGLLVLATVTSLQRPVALFMILLLALYAMAVSNSPRRLHRMAPWLPPPVESVKAPDEPAMDLRLALGLAALSVVFIVLGSELLVGTSLPLGSRLHIPPSIIGTFVLAVATSVPNSWATLSLARRGLGSTAVSATFNSNSINAALGAGFPALILTVHATATARTLDIGWLLGMTAVAILLLASRWTITRVEGSILIALYVAFVVVRLLWFS